MNLMLAFPLLVAASAQSGPPAAAPDPDQVQVDRASELISAAKPADAIAVLDPLIAAQEKAASSDSRQRYCARSLAETLIYTGEAASAKKSAVVLTESACYSIFLKGFALIDLGRSDEAKAYLDRAVAMAPENAQFLAELAEWFKGRKNWDPAWALFKRAEEAASFSPKDRQIFDRTRSMRGQAFILIERGKFDDAEAIYHECLKLDPNDQRSKDQLQYIAEHRGTKS